MSYIYVGGERVYVPRFIAEMGAENIIAMIIDGETTVESCQELARLLWLIENYTRGSNRYRAFSRLDKLFAEKCVEVLAYSGEQ